MRDFYYVDSGGILCYPDGRVMSPADAASKINKLVSENRRYKDRLQIDPGGSDKIDELRQSTDFLKHNLKMAEKQIEQWKDASGLECGGDADGVTPTAAMEYWKGVELQCNDKISAFQSHIIELNTDVVALRHDLEVAEHERNEARKELEEWRRAHSQPICNPPEEN